MHTNMDKPMEKTISETPKVSIVIMTYKQFNELWKTLDNITQQNYTNIEVIISDDGSPQFPLQEFNKWKQEHGWIKVELYKNKINEGTVKNANHVIAYCNGEYIKFLSPGDGFVGSDSLENLVKKAIESKSRIVTSQSLIYVDSFSNVKYAFPSKRRIRVLKKQKPKELFFLEARSNFISAVGTLFHRRFFEESGFNEEYRYLDDWPTWLTVLRCGERIDVLENPTVYYGINGISNKAGNAFNSTLLREDMIHCFEKEILPYQSLIKPLTNWIVNYHYKELIGESMNFTYIPLKLYYKLKNKIKKFILY